LSLGETLALWLVTNEELEAEVVVARQGEIRPIIADLQGRNRIEYKTYANLRKNLLSRYQQAPLHAPLG
jgi:hypothetical protein